MKVVLAPNSFKGTLSSIEAVKWMKKGVDDVCQRCEVLSFPLADGGDDTIEVVKFYLGGSLVNLKVHDPLHREIEASFLENESGVWIELSSASGLKLLNEGELDPLRATTYGTGELLNYALKRGKKVFLAVGGSATIDGGAGILAALGVKFLDSNGNKFIPSGGNLNKISALILPSYLRKYGEKITILADVENSLLGESGAVFTYGPQKGADGKALEILEESLSYFADLTKRITGVDPASVCCGGAAGGVPAFLKALLGVEVRRGSDEIIAISGIENYLEDRDIRLVLTGEGKIDQQSFYGKIPGKVLEYARKAGKKVAGISGVLSCTDYTPFMKFDLIFPVVTDFIDYDSVRQRAGELLRVATGRVISIFLNLSG